MTSNNVCIGCMVYLSYMFTLFYLINYMVSAYQDGLTPFMCATLSGPHILQMLFLEHTLSPLLLLSDCNHRHVLHFAIEFINNSEHGKNRCIIEFPACYRLYFDHRPVIYSRTIEKQCRSYACMHHYLLFFHMLIFPFNSDAPAEHSEAGAALLTMLLLTRASELLNTSDSLKVDLLCVHGMYTA